MEAEAKALLQGILLANQFGITLNYIERDSFAFTNAMQSQVSLALLGRFTIKSDKERTFFKANKPLGW